MPYFLAFYISTSKWSGVNVNMYCEIRIKFYFFPIQTANGSNTIFFQSFLSPLPCCVILAINEVSRYWICISFNNKGISMHSLIHLDTLLCPTGLLIYSWSCLSFFWKKKERGGAKREGERKSLAGSTLSMEP